MITTIAHPTGTEWILLGIIVLLLGWGFRRGRTRNTNPLAYQAGVPTNNRSPVSSGTGTATIVLEQTGRRKIEVIKLVREATDCGLKEAKDIVDAAETSPQTIIVNISDASAQSLVNEFNGVGAIASVQ